MGISLVDGKVARQDDASSEFSSMDCKAEGHRHVWLAGASEGVAVKAQQLVFR